MTQPMTPKGPTSQQKLNAAVNVGIRSEQKIDGIAGAVSAAQTSIENAIAGAKSEIREWITEAREATVSAARFPERWIDRALLRLAHKKLTLLWVLLILLAAFMAGDAFDALSLGGE